MIEQVLKNIKEKAILIDVWTGSSCIPISILKNTDKVDKCFVVDISKKALEV
jgi:release factor glutamine methyltransferase